MRKHIPLVLILLIIIPSFGFGFVEKSPDTVLIKYIKTLYSNNLEKTFTLVKEG